MFKSFWKFRLSIVWVNLAVIAAFAAAGYGIGSLFGAAKIGLIVGTFVSFGPALAITTKVVRSQAESMVKRAPKAEGAAGDDREPTPAPDHPPESDQDAMTN